MWGIIEKDENFRGVEKRMAKVVLFFCCGSDMQCRYFYDIIILLIQQQEVCHEQGDCGRNNCQQKWHEFYRYIRVGDSLFL